MAIRLGELRVLSLYPFGIFGGRHIRELHHYKPNALFPGRCRLGTYASHVDNQTTFTSPRDLAPHAMVKSVHNRTAYDNAKIALVVLSRHCW